MNVIKLAHGRLGIQLDDGAVLTVPAMHPGIPAEVKREILQLVARRQYGEAVDTANAWNMKVRGEYTRLTEMAKTLASVPHVRVALKHRKHDDQAEQAYLAAKAAGRAPALSPWEYAILRAIRAGEIPQALNTVRPDFLDEDARDYPDGLFAAGTKPTPVKAKRVRKLPTVQTDDTVIPLPLTAEAA